MTTRKLGPGMHAWGLAAIVALTMSACAHRPEAGEKMVDCGKVYQIRAKQIDPPRGPAGVATIRVVVAGRYENAPSSQIRFLAPSGDFYVNELPREYAYTNSEGYLLVEWHPSKVDDGGAGEPTTLTFQGLELPGDCSVELVVDPRG